MSNVAAHPKGQLAQQGNAPKADEIRDHLQEILQSPAFHGSKRCQQFLAYVCDKSLIGETASLKERTIAVEVFGRSPESDLADDTIVRVGAREVRKRLQQYYLTPGGAAAGFRIDLPTGSYCPEFHKTKAMPETVVLRMSVPPRSRRTWLIALIAAGAIVAAILTARWMKANPEEQAFKRFWEPVFQSSDPLLVVVPNPIVYHPSSRAWRLAEQQMPAQDLMMPRPIQVPPQKLDGSDMLPVQNQYVGFGDLVAVSEVTGMLGQRSRRFRVRLSNDVQFPDLRNTNTLLVGAITNRWTMQLQQSWRFQFRWAPAIRTIVIDTMSPQRREWTVDSVADESYKEDYVVVSRIHNSLTGGLLLVGAGLKGFGTEAAGRLLADFDQLGGILRKLPAGWDAKNVQIVLHVKVIGNAPAQPELVAWHVW